MTEKFYTTAKMYETLETARQLFRECNEAHKWSQGHFAAADVRSSVFSKYRARAATFFASYRFFTKMAVDGEIYEVMAELLRIENPTEKMGSDFLLNSYYKHLRFDLVLSLFAFFEDAIADLQQAAGDLDRWKIISFTKRLNTLHQRTSFDQDTLNFVHFFSRCRNTVHNNGYCAGPELFSFADNETGEVFDLLPGKVLHWFSEDNVLRWSRRLVSTTKVVVMAFDPNQRVPDRTMPDDAELPV